MLNSLRSKSILLTFTRIVRPAVALTVICVTAVTAAAAAQNDDIHTRVMQGQRVFVTDAQGREFRGRILDVSSDSLTIEVGRSRRDIPRAEILRIDRVDDLKNGALIGALVGGGLLAAEVRWARENGLYLNPAGYAVFGTIYCGLGAAVGVGFDALIGGRHNLYRRGSSATMRVVPQLSRHQRGVSLGLSW